MCTSFISCTARTGDQLMRHLEATRRWRVAAWKLSLSAPLGLPKEALGRHNDALGSLYARPRSIAVPLIERRG